MIFLNKKTNKKEMRSAICLVARTPDVDQNKTPAHLEIEIKPVRIFEYYLQLIIFELLMRICFAFVWIKIATQIQPKNQINS